MTDQPRDDATEALGRLLKLDISSLARIEDYGTATGFADIVGHVESCIDLLKDLPADYFNTVPMVQSTFALASQVQALDTHISGILEYDGAAQDAPANRRRLITETEQTCTGLYQAFGAVLPYVLRERINQSSLNDLETRAAALVQQAQEVLQSVEKQAQELLTSVRQVAEEQGVTQHASVFSTEADNHETRALSFLISAGIFGILLLALSTVSIFWPTTFGPKSEDIGIIATVILGKLLLVGTLTAGLFFSLRNYTASKHNSVVNLHRQHALQTHRVMTEASNNPTAQEVILTQAAHAIYSARETGFGKQPQSPSNPTNLIDGIQHVVKVEPSSAGS